MHTLSSGSICSEWHSHHRDNSILATNSPVGHLSNNVANSSTGRCFYLLQAPQWHAPQTIESCCMLLQPNMPVSPPQQLVIPCSRIIISEQPWQAINQMPAFYTKSGCQPHVLPGAAFEVSPVAYTMHLTLQLYIAVLHRLGRCGGLNPECDVSHEQTWRATSNMQEGHAGWTSMPLYCPELR